MKKIASALLLTAAYGSTAFAGSVVAPVVDTVAIAPPVAQDDWGGFYLGGMYGLHSGTWVGTGQFSDTFSAEGNLYGAFAGYNVQRNALVFGGELAYSMGDITYSDAIGPIPTDGDTFLDAKARLGYAAGNVLVYGVAGGTMATSSDALYTADLTGFNYGGGAQMKLSNGLFFGAEYLVRDVSGVNPNDNLSTIDLTTQTIQIRVGKQF